MIYLRLILLGVAIDALTALRRHINNALDRLNRAEQDANVTLRCIEDGEPT